MKVRSEGAYEFGRQYDRTETVPGPDRKMSPDHWLATEGFELTGDGVTARQGSWYRVTILEGPPGWVGRSREWTD